MNDRNIVFSLASGRCQCALSGCPHPNGRLGAARLRRGSRCRREFAFWEGGWEIDHIKPPYLGGEDVPANKMLLCKECHDERRMRQARQDPV